MSDAAATPVLSDLEVAQSRVDTLTETLVVVTAQRDALQDLLNTRSQELYETIVANKQLKANR